MDFIAKNAKTSSARIPGPEGAIIHEDGAYGIDGREGQRRRSEEGGFNVVMRKATRPLRRICPRW